MKYLQVIFAFSLVIIMGCTPSYFYNPKNQPVEVEVRFYRDGTCSGTVNGIELPRKLHTFTEKIVLDHHWYWKCGSTERTDAVTAEDYRNIDLHKTFEFELYTPDPFETFVRKRRLPTINDRDSKKRSVTYSRYRGDPREIVIANMFISIRPPKPIGGLKFFVCTVEIQIDDAVFVLNTLDENDELMDIFNGAGYRQCQSIA